MAMTAEMEVVVAGKVWRTSDWSGSRKVRDSEEEEEAAENEEDGDVVEEGEGGEDVLGEVKDAEYSAGDKSVSTSTGRTRGEGEEEEEEEEGEEREAAEADASCCDASDRRLCAICCGGC